MFNFVWNALKLGPALLGASLLIASSTLAAQKPAAENAIAPMAPGAESEAADTQETIVQSSEATQEQLKEIAIAPAQETQQPQIEQLAAQPNINIAPVAETPVAENASPAPVVAESTTVAQTPVNSAPAVQNTEVLEQINRYNGETGSSDSMDQVTNISQLRDVQPTDWAYEALRSLVERYGCIAGYPDGTYRGNRALSRFEFAAGLNACLLQIEKLIAASTADFVTKEDLATLQRLIDEFGAELATLRTRVDNLEARTKFLEENQFSTTTKLAGEVIFAIADAFGEDRAVASGQPNSNQDIEANTILANRVRLNFDTSFTGRDRLRTRLEAANIPSFGSSLTGTNMTRLGFEGTGPVNTDNDVAVDELYYRFPVGQRLTVQLDAVRGEFNDTVIPTVNPLFESSGSGSISRFGRFNPIYRSGNPTGVGGGGGASFNYSISKALSLSGGYFARRSNDPGEGRGLFDGTYAALGQLTFQPSNAFSLGLTYVHGYYSGSNTDVSVSGGTGSSFANTPFGSGVATTSNSYGLEANLRLSPRFSLGGWVGYTNAIAETSPAGPATRGSNADIFNAAVNVAFPDLGKRGNLLGFVFGIPPKVTDNEVNGREDNDTSYHLEGFYRLRVTDNIAITPGLIVILNPEHNDNNDSIYVGTIRTTFTF